MDKGVRLPAERLAERTLRLLSFFPTDEVLLCFQNRM